MFLTDIIQNIITAGSEQLISWVTSSLPQVFLFLIFLNAVTRMIGRTRIERLARRCGSNIFLRYLVLPFLSAIVLGNPMAISMGRYLPEEYKPAYFASVSYHCHTNSGIFQHINPAELFLWLGVSGGVLALDLDIFPLAVRYMCAGLVANFLSGYVTEIITRQIEKKKNIRLSKIVDLRGDIAANRASFSEPVHVYEDSEEISEPAVTEVSGSRECERSRYRSITITRGSGGYGGPVTITPTEDRHIVLYMTGGGTEPEPLARILELSGMEAVNGNLEVCPDEKVALAVIDCGGTLRCGIYPGKGIPTANILATGRSGPLAKYMREDLYVSAVTSAEISASEAAAEPRESGEAENGAAAGTDGDRTPLNDILAEAPGYHATADAAYASVIGQISGQPFEPDLKERVTEGDSHSGFVDRAHRLFGPITSVSRIVSIFYQSARDAVRTCLYMLLPFMGFAALFVGLCRGSGLTQFLTELIEPMGGSLPGLFATGILCSLPGFSAILGAGAVAAQMFATVIGDLIVSGSIAPALALPALFAINCQCACDFIPVGLGMMESKTDTVQIGISAVTMSRFATGWIRILIALIFSIGLYT